MTTATRPAPTAEKIAASYARQEAILRDEIAELNVLLGLAAPVGSSAMDTALWADRHKVTFGYVGNCDANGGNDHRSWMVFLPHPGRVGTADDQVGSFSTGDLAGIVATRRALKSVAQGVRLAQAVIS